MQPSDIFLFPHLCDLKALFFYAQDWAYSMSLFLHAYHLRIKAVFQQFLENSQMQLSVRYILKSGLTR